MNSPRTRGVQAILLKCHDRLTEPTNSQCVSFAFECGCPIKIQCCHPDALSRGRFTNIQKLWQPGRSFKNTRQFDCDAVQNAQALLIRRFVCIGTGSVSHDHIVNKNTGTQLAFAWVGVSIVTSGVQHIIVFVEQFAHFPFIEQLESSLVWKVFNHSTCHTQMKSNALAAQNGMLVNTWMNNPGIGVDRHQTFPKFLSFFGKRIVRSTSMTEASSTSIFCHTFNVMGHM